MELHAAIAHHGLTTMRLIRRGEAFDLRLSRDWDPELDWSGYGAKFRLDQVPCAAPVVLANDDARACLESAAATPALERLEALMQAGRHEMVSMRVHTGLGVRPVNHVHSSEMGINNGQHALRAGGIRRHEADEPEEAVLIDGLNLGRGMSYKNAAAQIPFGGCKMTVQCAPFALDDHSRLGFVAYCVDAGHFFTGPDMGFAPELADALRARYTKNIVGGPAGAMGPTGTPTARGTVMAMRECARAAWGTDALSGRSGLVQGLGAVGAPLARAMKAAGMALMICDPDPARVDEATHELGDVQVVQPAAAMSTPCDILAPCAVGGIFDAAAISKLGCKIICGSANNQLAAVSKEEEIALADRIRERGVLYPPEWTHNIAGVLAGMEEYLHQEDADMARLDPHLERVCQNGTRDLLARAAASGRSATALAYDDVERRIRAVDGA